MTDRVRSRLTVLLLTTVLAVTGCSGGDKAHGATPEEALASAKKQLDETSGVQLDLKTDNLPDGINGLTAASGVATHAPAFDGEVELIVAGLSVKVPVVAVDGTVYAQLPFTNKFAEIDPDEYGAPDPAQLMSPDTGISTWLTEATDVEEGEKTRDEGEVVTSYTGTLPGTIVHRSIPSAVESADFDVTFLLDEDHQLRSAEVAGPFYDKDSTVDYTIQITDYGTDKEITRP